MIFFKIYTWSYSAGVVSYLYLHCTWKYKTYRNPMYMTMIKKDLFQDLTWFCSAGVDCIDALTVLRNTKHTEILSIHHDKNDFFQDLYLVIVVYRRCSFIFDTYTVSVKINKIKFQFVN